VVLQISLASSQPVIRIISSGPGWLTLLLTFLIGAATALAVQLVIQLYVVPRVETRKRREDRWERNVIELGDLLTTELRKRAFDAQVEQGKFRDLRQLESEPGLDQRKIAQSREDQAWTAQQATSAFADLLRTRVDWLIGRIGNYRSSAGEIARFRTAAQHYRARTILVQVRAQDDDRTESDFETAWAKERDARAALINQVNGSWICRIPRASHGAHAVSATTAAGSRAGAPGGTDNSVATAGRRRRTRE
jgi:hypothetical protein